MGLFSHVAGPRKRVFSVVATTLWNIIPKNRIGPNCWLFARAKDMVLPKGMEMWCSRYNAHTDYFNDRIRCYEFYYVLQVVLTTIESRIYVTEPFVK